MDRSFWNIPVLVSLICLCACASTTDILRESDDQATDLTVQDEIQMTKEVLVEMSKEYPPHPDLQLQGYVRAIGEKIVIANNLDNNPYEYSFTVVSSEQINAFALPAVNVFITSGLIKVAESEAELAGVIGHEMAHVTSRHAAKRIYAQKKGQKKDIIYGTIGAVGGGLAGIGVGKLICKKGDKKCVKRASIGGLVAGGASGLLVRKYTFMKNSQRDEMQADREGFKYAINAQYSKDHVGNFYKKLLEMEGQYKKGDPLSSAFADAFSTHPPSRERVTQMNRLIMDTQQSNNSIVRTENWNEIKSRVSR